VAISSASREAFSRSLTIAMMNFSATRAGDDFDFPYKEVWPILKEMVKRIGSEHLLWGTDMPFQNRFCTYRQSRDWIEKHCTFLGQEDLARLMGGTAARILGV